MLLITVIPLTPSFVYARCQHVNVVWLTPAWKSLLIALVNVLFIHLLYLALRFSHIFRLPSRDKILCQGLPVIDQVGASNQPLAGQQAVHFTVMGLFENFIKEQIYVMIHLALFGRPRLAAGTCNTLQVFKDKTF